MTSFYNWLQRGVALLLAMLVILPFGIPAQARAQQTSPAPQTSPVSPAPASSEPGQPDSATPGTPTPDAGQQPAGPTEVPTAPAPVQAPDQAPAPAPAPGTSGQQSAPPSSAPAATPPTPDTAQQPTLSKRSEPQPSQAPTAPVGTAAAPYEKGIGVGASRPAGAVIAPAKQKRTRSFLIKSALVLGAAVAVGTVIGLSNASPSRPSN